MMDLSCHLAATTGEIMTSSFTRVLALSVLGLAITASAASALDRRVNINNKTQSVMTEFYASNTGADTWQEDILGKYVLDAGGSVTVNIDDGTGYCKYDFKAVFDDGSEVVSPNNNVCELSDFNITE
jgi:hypothetical protein